MKRSMLNVGDFVIKIEVVPFDNVKTIVKVVRTVGYYRYDGNITVGSSGKPGYVREYVFDWHELVNYLFHLPKNLNTFVVLR